MIPFGIAGLGPQELILILLVLVLLFGATKLPELARGSGRALRIFKAETKGLMDDDDAKAKPATQDDVIDAIEVSPTSEEAKIADLNRRQAELDAERARLNDSNG